MIISDAPSVIACVNRADCLKSNEIQETHGNLSQPLTILIPFQSLSDRRNGILDNKL